MLWLSESVAGNYHQRAQGQMFKMPHRYARGLPGLTLIADRRPRAIAPRYDGGLRWPTRHALGAEWGIPFGLARKDGRRAFRLRPGSPAPAGCLRETTIAACGVVGSWLAVSTANPTAGGHIRAPMVGRVYLDHTAVRLTMSHAAVHHGRPRGRR